MLTIQSNLRSLWSLATGSLSAGLFSVAVTDLFLAAPPTVSQGSAIFYLIAAVLLMMFRARAAFVPGWNSVIASGLLSALVTGTSLARIFMPGAAAEQVDASGIYLLLGLWMLMADTLYREIEIRRIGRP
jgi:hypothetical protein